MTSPSGETASAAPGSRGALRYVRTTVARPNVSPAAHHLVTLFRMSRTASPRPYRPSRSCPRNSKSYRDYSPLSGTAADAGRGGADQVGQGRVRRGHNGSQVVG